MVGNGSLKSDKLWKSGFYYTDIVKCDGDFFLVIVDFKLQIKVLYYKRKSINFLVSHSLRSIVLAFQFTADISVVF